MKTKKSTCFPFTFAVLIWVIGADLARANEPLWMDQGRLENRDLIGLGTVSSVYLRNLADETKQAFKVDSIKGPAFFLEMGSDVQKQKTSASPIPGSSGAGAFGPVIECTLGQLELLDLDTGQKAGPIAQGTPKQLPNMDVYLDFGADAQNRSYPMLNSQFLYTVRATNWNMSADELEAALHTNATPPRVRVLAKPQDSLPVTYWFRTRAGNLGTLQVLGFGTKPPEEVRIRYRLIKKKQ